MQRVNLLLTRYVLAAFVRKDVCMISHLVGTRYARQDEISVRSQLLHHLEIGNDGNINEMLSVHFAHKERVLAKILA